MAGQIKISSETDGTLGISNSNIPREEDIAIMIKGLFPDMQEYTHSETAFGGNNMNKIKSF